MDNFIYLSENRLGLDNGVHYSLIFLMSYRFTYIVKYDIILFYFIMSCKIFQIDSLIYCYDRPTLVFHGIVIALKGQKIIVHSHQTNANVVKPSNSVGANLVFARRTKTEIKPMFGNKCIDF